MESDGEGHRRPKRRRDEDVDRHRHQKQDPRGQAHDGDEYIGRHQEPRRYEYPGRHREHRVRDDERYEYHGRYREPRDRDDERYEDRGPRDYDGGRYGYRDRPRFCRSHDRRDPPQGDERDLGHAEGDGDPKRESDRGRTEGDGYRNRGRSERDDSRNQERESGRKRDSATCDGVIYSKKPSDATQPVSIFDSPPSTTASDVCSGPPELAGTAMETKIVQDPSECLVLNISFDQVTDKKKSDSKYIRYHILQKCTAAGGVDHIHVDTKRGLVYLRFRTTRIAMLAQEVFHGDFYEGNLITADFMESSLYSRMFPIMN